MPERTGHQIVDLDNLYAHAANTPGTLRVLTAPVTVAGVVSVDICKIDTNNNAVVVIGRFKFSSSDWTTLKVRNPTLALAAVGGVGN